MKPPKYLVAASIAEKRKVEATIIMIAEEELLLDILAMISQVNHRANPIHTSNT
jgi:hypothetical protein